MKKHKLLIILATVLVIAGISIAFAGNNLQGLIFKFNSKTIQKIDPCKQHPILCQLNISNDPIQKFIDTQVPANFVVEKIVVAVNKDFADNYSDWKQRIDRVVTDLNTGFAQTTKKKFEISKYTTYEYKKGEDPYSTSIQTLVANTNNYIASGSGNSCNTGRIFVFLETDDSLSQYGTGYSGGNNHFPSINQILGFSIFTEDTTHSTLLKESIAFMYNLEDSYWELLKKTAHEIGHSLGLAAPDWYRYEYEDLTDVDPQLPPYSLNQMYPFEPQTATGGSSIIQYPDKLWKFSDLNSFIINHGLCTGITTEQIKSAISDTIVVRVKDTSGDLVKNANVNVYGIDNQYNKSGNSDPKYFILKQSIQTNEKGNATIKSPTDLTQIPPVNAIFNAEIVKVNKDGKYGGSYLTLVDLQKTRLLNNSKTHYLDIVIK